MSACASSARALCGPRSVSRLEAPCRPFTRRIEERVKALFRSLLIALKTLLRECNGARGPMVCTACSVLFSILS